MHCICANSAALEKFFMCFVYVCCTHITEIRGSSTPFRGVKIKRKIVDESPHRIYYDNYVFGPVYQAAQGTAVSSSVVYDAVLKAKRKPACTLLLCLKKSRVSCETHGRLISGRGG